MCLELIHEKISPLEEAGDKNTFLHTIQKRRKNLLLLWEQIQVSAEC